MSIDLSLDRIRSLCELLPPYTRPTCHVAGTNGKGSVSALLSSILLTSALRVGRFNSPHLVDVHDCVTLDNTSVSSDAYLATRRRVEKTDADHQIGASSFELLTCTALQMFEDAKADIVVLEVGMGGRLDATNVIPDEVVLASALTAVDLDHQAFLGSSVPAIAREKAAIARVGKPFVLGKQEHSEVEVVVRDVVAKAGGKLLLAPEIASRSVANPLAPRPIEAHLSCFSEPIHAELPLHGEHQLANLGTALGVISGLLTHPSAPIWRERITPETIARGIQNTTWPGRLSFHKLPKTGTQVLVDGAHNAASARTLAAYITACKPRSVTYLLALSHSPPKTPLETLTPLLSVPADTAIAFLPFSPPAGMPWVNCEPRAALQAAAAAINPAAEIWNGNDDNGGDYDDPATQFASAIEWAVERQNTAAGDELIVVAGSLYLVADFYRLLRKYE